MSDDDTARHNMNYLGLNREQYKVHCKVMGDLDKATPGMRAYLTDPARGSFCGDAFACWVADYIKANPQDVENIR